MRFFFSFFSFFDILNRAQSRRRHELNGFRQNVHDVEQIFRFMTRFKTKSCKHPPHKRLLFPDDLISYSHRSLLWFLAVPRLYGDKLQFRFITPRNRRVQRRLVMLHDFFRTKVTPPAANMLSMVWIRLPSSQIGLNSQLNGVAWAIDDLT